VGKEYFCNPTVLMHPARFQAFITSLTVVLNTFDTQFLGDDYESSSHLDEEDDVMFNIKYLTSSNLMSLEV
jgi:THO complex subunit 1